MADNELLIRIDERQVAMQKILESINDHLAILNGKAQKNSDDCTNHSAQLKALWIIVGGTAVTGGIASGVTKALGLW